MLLDLGEDEKNCAILFVVLDVDEERLREGAMMGIAGVVAEVEKSPDLRGIEDISIGSLRVRLGLRRSFEFLNLIFYYFFSFAL